MNRVPQVSRAGLGITEVRRVGAVVTAPWPCPAYLTSRTVALTLVDVGRTSARGCTNAVRAARQAAGLTQAELAAAAGVTRQTVVTVEAGDYAPSVYLALAIAAHLGTTVEALFARQYERVSTPPGGTP